MTDRDGAGHSQEVVGSASGHVRLTAARGGVKLQAVEGERIISDNFLFECRHNKSCRNHQKYENKRIRSNFRFQSELCNKISLFCLDNLTRTSLKPSWIRTGPGNLQRVFQSVVQFHDSRLVATAIAVVWSTEDGHHVLVVAPVVALRDRPGPVSQNHRAAGSQSHDLQQVT